ncbi:MAG: DUF3017 domain-containing protein [Jatrophihabitans sp.]
MLGRAWRWIAAQWVFLAVLVGIVAALLYLLVEPGHWVRGTGAIAAVMLVAAVLRLILPTTRVGYLAVRSRGVDALVCFVLGGLILAVDIRLHR